MATQPVDYAALAEQARKSSTVDYAALAAQARGSTAAAPDNPAAEGFWRSLGAQFGITPEAAKQAANDAKDHPIKTAITGILGPAYQFGEGVVGQVKQSAGELGQAYQAYKGGNSPEAAVHAITAVPIVGPAMNKATGQYAEGNTAGQMGTLLGASINAAPIAAGAVEAIPGGARALRSVSNLPRQVVGGALLPSNLDTVIPGDTVTPRQRYEAAKVQGVNLDTAQATNATLPGLVKKATEHSLGGSGKFEANNAANVDALHDYSKQLMDSTAPEMSREQFGNIAKQKLVQDQQALNARAGQIYQDLDNRVGATTPDASGVQAAAQQIIDANKGYYDKHPELLTGGDARAWNVVKSLAKPGTDTWSDLHNLRSDLLDITRGKDLVGERPTGWIKQLTGAVDDAMTKGTSGPDAQDFREANEIYKYMKQTYDDPTSKMYHIVRAPDGLTAANTLASITPDIAQKIGLAAPDLVPQLQRQTMSRMLNPTGNELPDLKNLPARLTRAQKEQLNGVLTPDQISDLESLARTSRVVNFDPNPSGSGKVALKAAEGGAIMSGLTRAGVGALTGNPVAVLEGVGGPAAYFGGSRLAASKMTNPAFTESVMNAGQAAGKAAPRSVPMIPPIPGETMEDYLKRRKAAAK